MPSSLRQTIIASTAIIGLTGFAASAAPPGDPTIVHAPAAVSGQSTAATHAMSGKIEQRISELHGKLQISRIQQPQWDQFAEVMRDNARSIDQTFEHRAQAMPSMTATENMQSYAQVAMDHAQEVQKLVPAFQALYSTMSDSQKRMADQVFRDDAHHGDQARRS